MSAITTHVLDTSRGLPASGVSVRLERLDEKGSATLAGTGVTNDDGRVTDLLAVDTIPQEGAYRLTFEIGAYYRDLQITTFYPRAMIEFVIENPVQHYHVPLLLNPFGYSTYRGS